uniref:GPI inositol-deacylase n=1 Tax=Caenorhabditis japonica TaxID=281687 RepID=A0A8R1ELI4_CAEJA
MKYAPTNKYTLSVYNEGRHWWNVDIIEPGQIPVLFIPGSQGSAKQIRSLASLVQNKTESRRSPFSFRFFAVDFDEEVTFMNGNIMNRQLDYVMNAMRYIQKMMRVPRKIVLVGHSYGGMLAVLTTIHQDYQNDTELLILKGAPINKQRKFDIKANFPTKNRGFHFLTQLK